MSAGLLALLLTLGATPAHEPTHSPAIYNGRERQLRVQPPRVDTTVVVDGRLDERVWRDAAVVLTGFSQFSPQDGIPAEDSTEILIWYSPTAIHFGVRA